MGELCSVLYDFLEKNYCYKEIFKLYLHINGLVQERRNSIANSLELVFLALTHWY